VVVFVGEGGGSRAFASVMQRGIARGLPIASRLVYCLFECFPPQSDVAMCMLAFQDAYMLCAARPEKSAAVYGNAPKRPLTTHTHAHLHHERVQEASRLDAPLRPGAPLCLCVRRAPLALCGAHTLIV